MTATINRRARAVTTPSGDSRGGANSGETSKSPTPMSGASRRVDVQQQPRVSADPNDLPAAAAPTTAAHRPANEAAATTQVAPAGRCAAPAEPMMLWDPMLSTLAEGLTDVEQVRTAQSNRVRILTRTEPDKDGTVRGFGLTPDHPVVAAAEQHIAALLKVEGDMAKELAKQLRRHPLHPWIKAQTGLGDKQVARLLAAVQDPYWNNLHNRPRTVSELWAYCGLHVIPASHTSGDSQVRFVGGDPGRGGDTSHRAGETQTRSAGVAPSRRRGVRSNWSDDARMRVWNVANSCVRVKNRDAPYRVLYDQGRTKYADAVHTAPCARCGPAGHPAAAGSPLSDGHKHARALRLVMKTVLRDLWVQARDIYEAAETTT